MNLPSVKKVFEQLGYFVSLYHEAEEGKKNEVLGRMKKFLPQFDVLLDKMAAAAHYSIDDFVNDLMATDRLEALRQALAGAENKRDFSVGVFNIDYNPAEHRYVLHMPPYQGQDFQADFTRSMYLLAEKMAADEKVELVEGYSWIFNIPFVGDLFNNARFEDTRKTERNMNTRGEFSGSQRSALLFNKKSLREYLQTGEMPITTGRVYLRDDFLRDYLEPTKKQ